MLLVVVVVPCKVTIVSAVVNASVLDVIVSVSKTISSPDPANKAAQIMPGIKYMALVNDCDFVVGVSLIELIISINNEPYAMNP